MDYTKYNPSRLKSYSSKAAVDAGLRAYMIEIYKQVAIALLITGISSYTLSSIPELQRALFSTPLYFLVLLAPVGFAFYMSAKFMSFSVEKARACLWIYSGLLGISLSSLFQIYTSLSITRAFLITSSLFGAMSIYGHTTKKDLSEMGSFMIMGLIGVMIASLVNLFMRSSAIHFIISAASVIIFTGLTAYDTQKIKNIYYEVAGSGEAEGKLGVYGALSLYMSFINLFLSILQFFGERRQD